MNADNQVTGLQVNIKTESIVPCMQKCFRLFFTFPLDVFLLLSYCNSESLFSVHFLDKNRTRNRKAPKRRPVTIRGTLVRVQWKNVSEGLNMGPK